MKVTVIVPTYNASSKMTALMNRLQKQTLDNISVLIADSSSSDDTIEVARANHAEVLVVDRKEYDHGGTRTIAGKTAKGDLLVYLTQDVLPFNAHSLKALIAPFDNGNKVGAVYGRQLSYPDATPFAAHLRLFNYPVQPFTRSLSDKEKYGIRAAFLSNSFSAYRRSALEEVGWFKEGLISTEDTYAGAKLLIAGYSLAYAADAMVYHSHNYTLFQEFKRYFDIGVFHEKESWIRELFGQPEGEGVRYLRSELTYLIKMSKYQLFPEFFVRNALKYLGYSLGRNYKRLPPAVNKEMSMNREWWRKMDQ